MGSRPRITNKLIGEIVIDKLEYVQNKSSNRARKILNSIERIDLEIWCDQHYYNRVQLGDQYGKREGIEVENVKSLVLRSIQHLIYYSFKVKNFSFVNFERSVRAIRTVLQEAGETGVLNIVTEFHHLESNKYQVTIITAMQKDDFKISVGQYALETHGVSSTLKKFDGRNLVAMGVFD